jgi:hypothetical protein
MPEHHGCASWSRACDERLLGTASTTRRWLLLEQPGPWGHDALLESHVPPDLAQALLAGARRLGARPVLVRRPGRHPDDPDAPHTVMLADVDPLRPSLRRTQVRDLAAVPDLLERALDAGLEAVGTAVEGPVVLVCTHGRHDTCCAVEGRPTAAALAELVDEVWECSHVGGDRFAANVVALPDGTYHGRVTPADAAAVAAAVRSRRVSLPHYRGRSTLPFPVQAAEVLLREELGLDHLDAVTVRDHADVGDGIRVRFDAGDRAWTVEVAVERAATPRQLTCSAGRTGRPPVYRLLACRPDEVG